MSVLSLMPERSFLHLMVITAVLALTITAGAGAASPGNDAVTYLVNPAHTSRMYTPNLSPPLTKKWTLNLGATVSYPLIAQGDVYVVAGTNLYALSAATGQTVWGPIAVTGTYSEGYIAYDAGLIFLINFDGLLKAYDAATGTLVWVQQMPGQYAFSSAPTAVNGIVYVGGAGDGGTLYAVNEADGTVKWTQEVENGDNSSPAVTADGVYVSYVGPQTYKFDPLLGTPLWRYTGNEEGGGGDTSIFYDDQLYVRDVYAPNSTSNNVYILNSHNGTLLGGFDQGYFNNPVPPAFDNGLGYFVAPGGVLIAYNLSFTTQAWSFIPATGAIATSPLIVNGVVYVGTSTGNLYGVNETTGQQVWTDTVGTGISSGGDSHAALAAGDSLLLVPAGETLVAYDSTAAAPSAAVTSLTLDPGSSAATVASGTTVTATATLNVVAPTGGLTMALTSSLPGVAPVPATVTVPAGASSVSFTVPTGNSATVQTATLTASLGGASSSVALTLQPLTISGLSLIPNQVTAGQTTLGTVTLDSAAGAGGVTVALSCSDPAATLPATVTVPAGSVTGTFVLTSSLFSTASQLTVTAMVNGTQDTAYLFLTPIDVTHVLWDNTNGTASLWDYDTTSGRFFPKAYGPYAGWTAKSVADGPDGLTRLLWDNTTGAASVWSLDAVTGSFTQRTYGPYAGWTANAVSVNPNNATHILWNNTDGAAALWNYNTFTGSVTPYTYGPYSGWTAKALADGGTDGLTRLLWDKTDGTAALWTVTPGGNFTPVNLGPYAGWTATSVSVGPDNTPYILWDNTSGAASVWSYRTSAGTFTQNTYGPYAGWTAKALASGSDGKVRLLWTNTSGAASFWNLDNSTGLFSQFTFGSYSGWTATAISAGE